MKPIIYIGNKNTIANSKKFKTGSGENIVSILSFFCSASFFYIFVFFWKQAVRALAPANAREAGFQSLDLQGAVASASNHFETNKKPFPKTKKLLSLRGRQKRFFAVMMNRSSLLAIRG